MAKKSVLKCMGLGSDDAPVMLGHLNGVGALCYPQTSLVLVKCCSDYQAYFQLQECDTGSIQLLFQLCSQVQEVEGNGTNTR